MKEFLEKIDNDCQSDYPSDWWFLRGRSEKKKTDNEVRGYTTDSFVEWTCNIKSSTYNWAR